MSSLFAQLHRLVENSFPDITNFTDNVIVQFEKLENVKSFWSEIYLAHLNCKVDSPSVEVPKTVFIKIPKISENVLRCEDNNEADELHRVLVYYSKKENLFYKHFPHGSIPNFPFPKVYYTEDINGEATGGIVAENLADVVYAEEHIPGLSHEQILRLLEALAGLHSHLLKRENKDYVESFVEGAHGREMLNEQMQKMMYEEALTLETVAPGQFGNGRVQKIHWAFDYQNKNKAMAECIDAIPGILVHADLNVTNMLWRKSSSSMDTPSSDLTAIIDYQMALIGSVAFDIIRILTLGLRREIRKESTQSYLDHYYSTLCGFFDGRNAPFSREELSRQYSLIYPFASNFTLFGIALYIKMYADGTLGAPEKKQENVDELVSRALGIVEDIEALQNF